eukprot:g2433.t1
MACHGQGHCHTVSSTMAAFLFPFAQVLGLDVKYRGGYSWGGVNMGEPADETVEERHQWLEVTLRPSLQSYVCDLWVADAVGNDALKWPISEAYQNRLYPNGSFNIGQQSCPEEATDLDLPEL